MFEVSQVYEDLEFENCQKTCPSLNSPTSCTCCSFSLFKVTNSGKNAQKKKLNATLGNNTRCSKKSCPFRSKLSTRQRKTQIQDLSHPTNRSKSPMTDDVTESYHELPSSEDLQIFAKRVYCCVPFLLLSLVPFVLFYCIIAKAVGFFRCFFCLLLVLTEKIPWDWTNTSKNIVEFFENLTREVACQGADWRGNKDFRIFVSCHYIIITWNPKQPVKNGWKW